MNLSQAVKNFFKPKAFDPLENIDLNKVVGWRKVGGSTAFGYYQDHQYENGYSSISKLANGFAVIEPYTIDKTEKSVASNILDRLYTPNTEMSAYDFREALAVTSLVHDKVRLRVHHKGVRITPDSITGFTFLEGFTEHIADNKRYYLMPNGERLTDAEVITLRSINPDDVNAGFSASKAARRWTRLDDYIADYQKGFFENGAIPSGQLIITARTVSEFNDIVDTLKARHAGAGQNNNVTYTHRPTDQNGSPLNSQIEWVPFSSQNKDMALKDLFENVNKKIDSVYGVPEEIRGHLSNSNYASVAVAEKVFVKYALAPLTLKIWQKFTHELNRITGGTGVAISYKLEVPFIADEEKVKAEAKKLDAETVAMLTEQGYELDSAIEYVKTGDIAVLKLGKVIDEEKADVLSPEEARGTPSQPLDVFGTYVKSLDARFDDIMTKLDAHKPVEKQLDVIDQELYVMQLKRVIRSQMTRQVDRAVSELDTVLKSKAYGDVPAEEDELFTAEMMALLIPLMMMYGNKTRNTGINLLMQAGLTTQNIPRFEFTPAQRAEYQKYLKTIGTSYAKQTAEQIRTVLAEGILESRPKQEIEQRLRTVILGPDNEYRVTRLAKTEVNLSEGRASVYSMQNIAKSTGHKIYKVWNTSSSKPCPFCQDMNGKEVLVSENFVDLDEELHVEDMTFTNNWTEIKSAELHANCNCYTTYRVERG